ncbi:sialin-like [Bacillus rossius redtenbacheri]|uniref:sialin-like n=1 Tax=Bacillus rossius redtenbacheri TaxID=93214 RepID=UPI002FDDDC12
MPVRTSEAGSPLAGANDRSIPAPFDYQADGILASHAPGRHGYSPATSGGKESEVRRCAGVRAQGNLAARIGLRARRVQCNPSGSRLRVCSARECAPRCAGVRAQGNLAARTELRARRVQCNPSGSRLRVCSARECAPRCAGVRAQGNLAARIGLRARRVQCNPSGSRLRVCSARECAPRHGGAAPRLPALLADSFSRLPRGRAGGLGPAGLPTSARGTSGDFDARPPPVRTFRVAGAAAAPPPPPAMDRVPRDKFPDDSNSINAQERTVDSNGVLARVPARVVLGVMSFLGFFANYTLRVNINIAILEMVGQRPAAASAAASAAAPGGGDCPRPAANLSAAAGNSTQGGGEFDWSTDEQALVLGAFYWCYVLSLVPADLLAQRLGPKAVFGGANVLCALAAVLTPAAARLHYGALLAVRMLQGLLSGPTWPSMHVMVTKWIPPHERSKFVTTYYGNSVGAAATFPLCGVLIAHLGWEYAFYVPGAVGLLWSLLWWLLVFDSPAQHPRISPRERRMIEAAVNPHLARKQPPIPWKAILSSMPFWALMTGTIGSTWTFLAMLTYGPTYLKNVHGLGIEMNGLISGLPNVSRFLLGLLFSSLADFLLRSAGWTVTHVRKLATAVALLVPGTLCLLMTNVGCDAAAEITLLILLVGLGGCASSGTLANNIDLAPNFAGMLLGLTSFLSMSSGFLVPPLVSSIVGDQLYSMSLWRVVFSITAFISFFCCFVFLAFGSGEVQWWNGTEKQNHEKKEAGKTSTVTEMLLKSELQKV